MRDLIRRNQRRFLYLAGAGTLLLFLVLALPSIPVGSVGAQGTAATQDIARDLDDRIRSFFEELKNGRTTTAFDNILQNSPLGSSAAGSQISDMRARYEETRKNLFGEILDCEKHGNTKWIGTDIIVVRYILKCEQYPMVWTFTFYRKPLPQSSLSGPATSTGLAPATNTNSWTLIEMRFDSNLDLLSL